MTHVSENHRVFLTIKQVSERYGGSPTVGALNNWRSKGKGPSFVKIGGRVLYPLDKLIEWESSQTVPTRK